MRQLLTILLVFVSSLSFGQWNWPVQVNTFATPNANNYLSFFSDQYSNLQIMVTLTDQNATVVPAKLRIRMEGDGWWIETNPTNSIPSFELVPFETNIITGLDLQPYFFEGNLVKSSQNLDINNLPEGDVDICVEVFGIGGTLTTIGGVQCGMTRIVKLDAAQLTVPECDVALDTTNAFPTFMWSPPNGYFGGITGVLEYRLRIQEVQDPNNQVYFTNPDVGLITPVTEMDWTPATVTQANAYDLQFQVGMTYIWRVEARLIDNNGVIRDNMFRNSGISDYCVFTWGEAQTLEEQLASDLIINLNANYLTEFKGHAFWNCTNPDNQGLDEFPSYILEYRLKPDTEHPNPTWHFDTLSAEVKDIYQLSPEKTYQVRVSGKAGSYVSDPTAIVEFTTQAPVDYACGDQQIPFRPNLYDENENVQAGDQVQIGQFLMTLTEATPQYGPGRYKGKGWVPVDFLGGARAKVSFDDILIDKEYVVRDGRVDVVTDGIDAWLHEELKDFVDPIYVDGTVDSISVDTTAGVAWVIVDGNPLQFVFDPPDYPIVIHDENGYSFTIWPNGLVEVGSFLNPSNDHLDVSAENTVQFQQHPTEKYGFDPKEHIAWHENYEVIELSDSSYYFVANKSIGKDDDDKVNVTIPSNVTPTFKLNDQDVLTATSVDSIYTVQIPQINSSGKKELYVYNGNARIGKLNIHVYSEKQRDVVIVPIANVTVDSTALKTTLSETLGEANLKFNVTVAPQWNNTNFNSSTTINLPQETSLMTSYSQDMRDLRDAYFGDSSVQKINDAYYLFVIPQFDDANADGYMVRGKAMGFVKGTNYRTYAHEIAHGMGALSHTWNLNGPVEGTTNNLMDYNSGDNLIKDQWKELRNLDFAPSLLDDVEDGSFAQGQDLVYTLTSILPATVKVNDVVGFYTPGGSFIKPTIFPINRWIYDEFSGAVIAFELNDSSRFDALYHQQSSNFVGYMKELDYSIADFIRDSLQNSGITDPTHVNWYIENESYKVTFFNEYCTQYPQALWTDFEEASVGNRVTAAIRSPGTCDIYSKSFLMHNSMQNGLNMTQLQSLKTNPDSLRVFVKKFLHYSENNVNPILGSIVPIESQNYVIEGEREDDLIGGGQLLSMEQIEEMILRGENPVHAVVCGLLEKYQNTGKFPIFLINSDTPSQASLEILWEQSPSSFLYKLYASDVIETYGWEIFDEFMHEHQDQLQTTLSNYFIGRGNQQYATTQDLKDALSSAKNLYKELKAKIKYAEERYQELFDAFEGGDWDEKEAMTFAFVEKMTRDEIREFLPLNIRYRMIRVLCSVNLWQNHIFHVEESIAAKLFLTVKQDQIVPYVEGLISETINYDGEQVSLIYAMIDNLNGWADFFDGTYKDFSLGFADLLTQYYIQRGQPNLCFDNCPSFTNSFVDFSGWQYLNLPAPAPGDYGGKKYNIGDVLLHGSYDGKSDEVDISFFTITGKTQHANMAGGYHWYSYEWNTDDYTIHPFDLVLFDVTSELNVNLFMEFGAEDARLFPGFIFKYLEDQEFDRQTMRNINVAITLASIPFSALGLVKAVQAGKYATATFEFLDLTADAIELGTDNQSASNLISAYNALRLPSQIGLSYTDLKNQYISNPVPLRPSQTDINTFRTYCTDEQIQHLGLNDQTKVEDLKAYFDVSGVGISNSWINSGLLAKLDNFNDPNLKQKFIDDFNTATNQIKAQLNQNPDLVDAWKILESEQSIRVQFNHLNTVDDFIDKYPNRATILKQTFEDISYHPDIYAKENFLNALKEFDEVSTINNPIDLNTVLVNTRSVHKVKDLESKGIDKLFRGINVNAQGQPYAGNVNSITNGASTSTDPIVACIFSNEARTNFGGSGKIILVNTSDIESSFLSPANYRVSLEREVIIQTTPTNLYSLKDMEVDLNVVLNKIDEITGQNVSSVILNNPSTYALENTPRLTDSQLIQLINSL